MAIWRTVCSLRPCSRHCHTQAEDRPLTLAHFLIIRYEAASRLEPRRPQSIRQALLQDIIRSNIRCWRMDAYLDHGVIGNIASYDVQSRTIRSVARSSTERVFWVSWINAVRRTLVANMSMQVEGSQQCLKFYTFVFIIC